LVPPSHQPTEAILHTDGASSGNPGPAGAGFVIVDTQGRTLAEAAVPLGLTTVGVAEYSGLIAGLKQALSLGLRRLQAFSDSEFMCRQLQGRYRVKAPAIKPLYEEARVLIARLEHFEIHHTGREANERADALAKQAAQESAQLWTKDDL